LEGRKSRSIKNSHFIIIIVNVVHEEQELLEYYKETINNISIKWSYNRINPFLKKIVIIIIIIIIVILSNVLFTFIIDFVLLLLCIILALLYCANFVIGLRAVKFLHTNKFELNWIELLLLLIEFNLLELYWFIITIILLSF
jgi:hypothetical protein